MVVVGVLQFSQEPGFRTCTDPALAAFSRLPIGRHVFLERLQRLRDRVQLEARARAARRPAIALGTELGVVLDGAVRDVEEAARESCGLAAVCAMPSPQAPWRPGTAAPT